MPSMIAIGRAAWFITLTFWIFMHLGGALRAEPVAVDSLLVTAIDVSASMDSAAIKTELEGMAMAIQSPDVIAAIQAGPRHQIGFVVFLFADGEMPVIAGWHVVANAEDAATVAGEIASSIPDLTKLGGLPELGALTNIAAAMQRAGALVAAAPYQATRAVVNIVGDGARTTGDDPANARAALLAAGATVNGLIVAGTQETVDYFRHNVVGGRGAFVIEADKTAGIVYGFRRKFIQDLS